MFYFNVGLKSLLGHKTLPQLFEDTSWASLLKSEMLQNPSYRHNITSEKFHTWADMMGHSQKQAHNRQLIQGPQGENDPPKPSAVISFASLSLMPLRVQS